MNNIKINAASGSFQGVVVAQVDRSLIIEAEGGYGCMVPIATFPYLEVGETVIVHTGITRIKLADESESRIIKPGLIVTPGAH